MKTISVGIDGDVAFVDDDVYELVAALNWNIKRARTKKYAQAHIYRDGKRTSIQMHRLILEAPEGYEVDHRDENGLNNQRSNLRIASKKQNQANRGAPKNNSSGFKGVSPNGRGRWRASIFINGKTRRIGDYDTAKEAALAYNKAALEAFGEFAKINRVFDCVEIDLEKVSL